MAETPTPNKLARRIPDSSRCAPVIMATANRVRSCKLVAAPALRLRRQLIEKCTRMHSNARFQIHTVRHAWTRFNNSTDHENAKRCRIGAKQPTPFHRWLTEAASASPRKLSQAYASQNNLCPALTSTIQRLDAPIHQPTNPFIQSSIDPTIQLRPLAPFIRPDPTPRFFSRKLRRRVSILSLAR